jgi:hypothetical protein
MFMLYAFHKLGCVGEVPLHYAGRRHQSAYVSPHGSRSDQLAGVAVHRLADGGDRGQDHVGDDLGLRDHDHVGALDLGDRRPGAPSHGTDDIAASRLVASGNHGPGGRCSHRTEWII